MNQNLQTLCMIFTSQVIVTMATSGAKYAVLCVFLLYIYNGLIRIYDVTLEATVVFLT